MRAFEMGALLALLAACGAHGPVRDLHPGHHQLTVHNLAGGSVCGFYAYPTSQTQQGANLLEPASELRSGDSRRLWLVPGDYQIQATGCAFEKLNVSGYAPTVRMGMNGVVVLYREDDAKSKDAARGIAHENENTYLVVATLERNLHPTSRSAPKELDSEKPPLR